MYITKSTLVNALRSHQWKRHIHQCSFFATECGREGGVPYEARIHCCNSLPQKLMLVGHREPYGGQVCVCVLACVWASGGWARWGEPPTWAVPLSWLSARFLPHTLRPPGEPFLTLLHFTSSLIQESVTNTWGERRGRLNPIRLDWKDAPKKPLNYTLASFRYCLLNSINFSSHHHLCSTVAIKITWWPGFIRGGKKYYDVVRYKSRRTGKKYHHVTRYWYGQTQYITNS